MHDKPTPKELQDAMPTEHCLPTPKELQESYKNEMWEAYFNWKETGRYNPTFIFMEEPIGLREERSGFVAPVDLKEWL